VTCEFVVKKENDQHDDVRRSGPESEVLKVEGDSPPLPLIRVDGEDDEREYSSPILGPPNSPSIAAESGFA
jgi:hypothetical protein